MCDSHQERRVGLCKGNILKPEVMEGNAATQQAANRWEEANLKSQSDIMLAFS